MQSATYSSNTLIILLPDESGGFYDHVPLPPTNPIDNKPYGPRTWFIAVGNMVKKNYVSHVQMEPASLIKFVEWNWLAGGTGQVRKNPHDIVMYQLKIIFFVFTAWYSRHKCEQYR